MLGPKLENVQNRSFPAYLDSVELSLVKCSQCGLVYLDPQPGRGEEVTGPWPRILSAMVRNGGHAKMILTPTAQHRLERTMRGVMTQLHEERPRGSA